MATRSRIGMRLPNKNIISIYCHYDGYPDGVGKTLKQFYAENGLVEKLISKGNLRELNSKLMDNEEVPYSGGGKISRNENDFRNHCVFCGAEYAYIWNGSKWRTLHIR